MKALVKYQTGPGNMEVGEVLLPFADRGYVKRELETTQTYCAEYSRDDIALNPLISHQSTLSRWFEVLTMSGKG
ncbi:hypothetical protein ES708_30763 [subsurface metagenome]